MAQVLVLVVESKRLLPRLRIALAKFLGPREDERPTLKDKALTIDGELAITNPETVHTGSPEKALWKDNALWAAVSALLLLLSVLVLQILGLAKAVRGSKGPEPLVSWCSPIFAPFGVAVLDGNCNLYPIAQTFKKGAGCIMIQGSQQMSWLKATVAGTSLSLCLEVLDVAILVMVHSKARWYVHFVFGYTQVMF